MNYIYHIYEKEEIYLMNILHKIKFNDTKEDIQMLYPGFMKTALFENTRFNMEDDLEPGYSFYILKPLTDCGYVVNYIMTPPVKFNICEYTDYKKDYNTVNLLNEMRKYINWGYDEETDEEFDFPLLKKDIDLSQFEKFPDTETYYNDNWDDDFLEISRSELWALTLSFPHMIDNYL